MGVAFKSDLIILATSNGLDGFLTFIVRLDGKIGYMWISGPEIQIQVNHSLQQFHAKLGFKIHLWNFVIQFLYTSSIFKNLLIW